MSETTHGGRVLEASKALGLPLGDIIDFSANINPLGPPRGLGKVLRDSIPSLVHYPEIGAESLVAALARHDSLPVWSVMAGAGSTPLIYALARLLRPRSHLIVAPAFAEYGAALEAAGCGEARYLPLEEDSGFLLGPGAVDAILADGPDLVVLANPANPTGRLVPPGSLARLVEASARGRGFTLMIDEAFMGFCRGAGSALALVPRCPRLVVLRSLTKIFAVPGLRLGYLASGDRELMAGLAASAEPWHINTMAQNAGLFFLGRGAFARRTPGATAALRSLLAGTVAPFLETLPSDANFIVGRLRRGRKADLIRHLFQRAILVRDLDGMPGMPPGFLRLAVRPRPEIARLGAALGDFFAPRRASPGRGAGGGRHA
ncbi:MAG: aminotransferase class I/II-fold pyridoxal phosphate-dependent enzyme [Deltaproteobacteria bacterium]|jgi:threonine-phosphate decarboxylase|nr:aminotransferase class I/II-fold pyridoxal phosphate-dependent enzyme [Deltaproteobacteria bacterium]